MTLRQKLKDKAQLLERITSGAFLKYAISGLTALAADYLAFLGLYYIVGSSIVVATVISQTTGLFVSYAMNRFWVFGKIQKKPALMQFLKLSALFLCNTAFSYLIIGGLTRYGIAAYAAKLFTIFCIVSWNYFLYKKLIF